MCRVPDAGKLAGMQGSTREKRSTKCKQSDASNCISNKQVTTFWASQLNSSLPAQQLLLPSSRIAFRTKRGKPCTTNTRNLRTQSGTCRFPSVSSGAQTRSPGMMIPEQRPADQNSMFFPREWQPSQESGTNLTNFSMSPLSKRAVKSSHPSRLAEVCHAHEMEGGKEGGELESLSTEGYGCANKWAGYRSPLVQYGDESGALGFSSETKTGTGPISPTNQQVKSSHWL